MEYIGEVDYQRDVHDEVTISIPSDQLDINENATVFLRIISADWATRREFREVSLH